MLIINDRNYEEVEKFIDYDLFEGRVNNKKRKGRVLYITLKTNDFIIGIETVYDEKWIKELKINDKKDITKYLVGLPYDDKKEFKIYLLDKGICTINRIDDNSFEFSLNGVFKECDELLKIEYYHIFKI